MESIDDVIADKAGQQVRDIRDSSFVWVEKAVLQYTKRVGPKPIALYLHLASHTNNETGGTYVKTDTLAEQMDVSKRSIYRWRKELEDEDLIEVKKRENKPPIVYLTKIA